LHYNKENVVDAELHHGDIYNMVIFYDAV